MVARDIEYVELYAGERQSVIDYYCSALGFAQVAESAGAGARSALLRQGTVQLVVTTGPATETFLDAHGDGIADIALACDDLAAVGHAATTAGARVHTGPAGYPVVTGFGDVGHTLLPAAAPRAMRLPPGRDWTSVSVSGGVTSPAASAVRLRYLDHVAVCVAGGSLADQADFYLAALGLDRYSSEYVAVGDQAMDSIVVRSSSGGVTFTLVAPDPAKSPGQLNAFLARNGGPGVQHLAFGVDDIFPAVAELRARGVDFLPVPAAYYDQLAVRLPGLGAEIAHLSATSVLADRDEWGYLLQLFTRSPHERNTLFYELIQRRGARGFGSANIRALYEAVERDRLATE
jgi:4-hydroxymandelate synthase